MTRRADGTWEITHGEFKRLLVLWPLIMVLFSMGAAWEGVHLGLDGKVDKTKYNEQVNATNAAFQQMHEDNALRFQQLRAADSLQQAAQRESNDRLREIVCHAVNQPGCR